VVDTVGSRTLAEYRRVLTPKGVFVSVGGPVKGQWIRPLLGPIKLLLLSPFVSQKLAPFLTRESRDDLAVLRELLESAKVTPVKPTPSAASTRATPGERSWSP
jgi:NADPH:quinone reductase-like Zn-dependent oxidoreductase